MKPTAYLIDISRGGIVDHTALVAALKEHKIGGAALDVFPEEPLASRQSPLEAAECVDHSTRLRDHPEVRRPAP